MSSFKIIKKSEKSGARTGVLDTQHGKIKTPFFMPIATVGAVKTLTFEDLEKLKAQIVLSNTYHLMLRPGENLIKKFGGLHKFMNWRKPILTDSGGFQVFSLAKMRKITNKGVRFQSHIDGKKYLLTPEKAIKIQQKLGSDIIMVLDECVSYPAKREEVKKAVERTTAWARRSKELWAKSKEQRAVYKGLGTRSSRPKAQSLFGIVQGGVYKDLRLRSVEELVPLNFEGYAIGGLAVGESEKEMYKMLNVVCPELPENKPRYLMGLGKPEQIVEAVRKGVDMFDCVIPTREARHGKLYRYANIDSNKFKFHSNTDSNKFEFHSNFYETVNIQNKKFRNDTTPINVDSKFEVLRRYSKAYLRHLFLMKEPLALRLATLNNVEFYLELMERVRWAVRDGIL